MLTRKTVLQAKIETTYGTAPSMSVSDAILIGNLSVGIDPTIIERSNYRDTISAEGVRVGKKIMTCSFDVELKGRGIAPTAGSPIEFDAIYRACGNTVSDDVTSGRVYTPTSVETSMVSVALRFNLDGQQYLMTGCYGNVSFNIVAGQIAVMTFTFTGMYNTPTDVAQIQPTFVNDTQPPIVESIALEIDSYAGIIENFTIDYGNEISERPDVNSAEGLKGLRITNRNVNGSIDPEMVSVATKDFYTIFEDSSEETLDCTIGSDTGNKFDIAMPTVQLSGLTPDDRNGLRIFKMDYVAKGDDDEITLRCY